MTRAWTASTAMTVSRGMDDVAVSPRAMSECMPFASPILGRLYPAENATRPGPPGATSIATQARIRQHIADRPGAEVEQTYQLRDLDGAGVGDIQDVLVLQHH